jgi:hypothetical protein
LQGRPYVTCQLHQFCSLYHFYEPVCSNDLDSKPIKKINTTNSSHSTMAKHTCRRKSWPSTLTYFKCNIDLRQPISHSSLSQVPDNKHDIIT